jgi:hypothetical protein
MRSAAVAARILFALVAVLLAAVSPLTAVQIPQGPEAAFEMRRPEMYVDQVVRAAAQLAGEARLSELDRIGSPAANSYVDLRTGRWATLQPTVPLLPGGGVGNHLRWESFGRLDAGTERQLADSAWQAFASWVTANADWLRIDPAEVVSPGRVTVISPDYIVIWAPRRVGGVPVREAGLTATLRHGNLVLFGAENWGDIDQPGFTDLSHAQAEVQLSRHLSLVAAGNSWKPAELAWVPVSTTDDPAAEPIGQGIGYRLAWVLKKDLGIAGKRFEALVDATDGTVLQVVDTVQYAASQRLAQGGVYPVSNDGASPDGIEQADWPMPFETVTIGAETAETDAGGNLAACVDGPITSHLSGPYVNIVDTCGAISLTSSGHLNFGTSGGTNCTTPGFGGPGNTHASRTGFYELNRLKEMARGQLPTNLWLQEPLTANMNINLTCNAFWNGSTVNFYHQAGACSNLGEIAAVFDHEWGHGLDNNGGNPSISSPGEAIADIYASLRLDESCIGRGVRATNCGGYGDACLDCTGFRESDWDKNASHSAMTITSLLGLCPAQGTRGPCNRETHCEGQIVAQVAWDFWNRDLVAAPYNYSLDRAREIATQMAYRGAGPVTNWYSCSQGTGGCAATNGYPNFLAADDVNGNLNDGTPHMAAIFSAFNRHGIACGTPAVVDAGCTGTPATAPVVVAEARNRGARLTWSAVAGATSYRIFRTDGVFACDFGKTLMGETDGLEYVDSDLQNGRDYSYIVIPMGAGASCFGEPSSCTGVTPLAASSVTAVVERAEFEPLTGDGDPAIDNCETWRLSIPLSNTGLGTLTNLQIVAASSPSHAGVVFPGPFPITVTPSLANCGEATGQVEFIAGGLTPGAPLTVEVELHATEFGASNRTATVTFGLTELSFDPLPTRTFAFEAAAEGWSTVSGTFVQSLVGGGADGSLGYMRSSTSLDSQCDVVQSPRLILSAASTLQASTNFTIEPVSDTWYDRANLSVIDVNTNARTLVSPSSGRVYNASGPNGPCGTNNQGGWAGTMASWASSSWNAAALHSADFAGAPVRLQINYGTDSSVNGTGFKFDSVTVTNASWEVSDTQSNVCSGDPLIFSDGFEIGNTSHWSLAIP